MVAIVGFGSTSLPANETANQRIRTVIEQLRDNPIPGEPAGTHLNKPEQVFSRKFNASLSTQAYLQLHTDPSLDDSGVIRISAGERTRPWTST